MIWIKFKRVVRAGFANFWRNMFVSLSSVLVMIVTLSFIATLIFGNAALNSTLATLKEKVDINVYFVTTANPDDILALQKTLEKMPEVASVIYTSREDALEAFKKRHPDDGTIEALNELADNPLGAVLNVQAKLPSQYEGIARFLNNDNALSKGGTPIVRKVNFYEHEASITALGRIIDATHKLGIALTAILILISVLITFNTIRLTIYTAREEISVMKLVGASNRYVRGPFVVSGIAYGVIAAFFTLLIFYPISYSLQNFSQNFFIGINFFRYYVSNFGQIFLVIVGSGVVIGAISSWLAVRRYLRV